ncbi:hypothetical protein [Streptomyces sp. NPDC001980]|uniref:hypothetical protein n=1 Tax=Streptomyces sp. NPDC001980 TaxID=3157126 RepID=UPI0033246574
MSASDVRVPQAGTERALPPHPGEPGVPVHHLVHHLVRRLVRRRLTRCPAPTRR